MERCVSFNNINFCAHYSRLPKLLNDTRFTRDQNNLVIHKYLKEAHFGRVSNAGVLAFG